MKQLTEQDIAPLWDLTMNSWFGAQPIYGPAVVRARLNFANAILSTFGGVSEVEARERERTAWDAGAKFRWPPHRNVAMPSALMSDNECAAQRELVYPSLTPTPRTVTLGGQTYRRDGGEWQVSCDIARGGWLITSAPICRTIEDFEACAALLREEQAR